MSTSIALRPSVRAALYALIDYAGLFPPAKLPMDEAAAQYAQARRGPHAWMLGHFIVPASRIGELREARVDTIGFGLSVIVDADGDPRRWFGSAQSVLGHIAELRERGVRIESLEAPLPPLATQRETHDAAIGQFGALLERAGLRDLPAFVEWPRATRWLELLDGTLAAVGRAALHAKLRCGGATPEAFPSVEDVAAFVASACAQGVAFKATAGLHHPIRHLDTASGATMHGFLNLLAAAALAPRADRDTLDRIVAEEDAGAFEFDATGFCWRDRCVSTDDLSAMRATAFTAYGSCSFAEPVEDLTALRILAPQ